MTELLLNIGNTHIQLGQNYGTDENPRIELLETMDTSEFCSLGLMPVLEKMPHPWRAKAVCVVPAARRLLTLKYGQNIRFLETADFSQLDFSLVDQSTLGKDRIANAAAAFALGQGKNPVTVIDFGTCINTVSVDDKGRFLGGVIMPGRMLSRKALGLYTAQLPIIPLSESLSSPLARNTVQAISGGIDLGIVGAVREVLQQTRKELGDTLQLYAAGGDAPFFQKQLSDLFVSGENVPRYITLFGVQITKL